MTWLKNNNTCPYCRLQLKIIINKWLYIIVQEENVIENSFPKKMQKNISAGT
jgi:hypothetical protein